MFRVIVHLARSYRPNYRTIIPSIKSKIFTNSIRPIQFRHPCAKCIVRKPSPLMSISKPFLPNSTQIITQKSFFSTNYYEKRHTKKNIKEKAFDIYRYASMTEGLDDSLKTTINRGFAWLAMSRWLLQDDAMEIFEEAEKLAIAKN